MWADRPAAGGDALRLSSLHPCPPRTRTHPPAHSPPPPPTCTPTPWSGALRAAADHRPVRRRRPAAATGPAPAWRRHRLGPPPLPTRPAQASAPRPRFQLAAGPAARSGARNGRADALAHAPPTARPARRACPRRARRPHGVGLSGRPGGGAAGGGQSRPGSPGRSRCRRGRGRRWGPHPAQRGRIPPSIIHGGES